MTQLMQCNITSEFEKFKNSIKALESRVSQCECTTYGHEQSLYGSGGPINYKLKELTQSIERLGEQLIKANANINALQVALNDLNSKCEQKFSQLRPETDDIFVLPKQNSDLEISEQNIDDRTNNYIDLDLITDSNYKIGVFDDDNWYNLQ